MQVIVNYFLADGQLLPRLAKSIQCVCLLAGDTLRRGKLIVTHTQPQTYRDLEMRNHTAINKTVLPSNSSAKDVGKLHLDYMFAELP